MAERFFKDRLWDALERSLRDQTPAFLGFFDEHQAKEAALALGKQPEGFISFFGGYLGAERVMLGFFPSFQEKKSCFPLKAITAVFPDHYSLSHRDVLGTVMSVGVQRETIGDILVEQGSLFEKAGKIAWAAEQKEGTQKENGSVILLRVPGNTGADHSCGGMA